MFGRIQLLMKNSMKSKRVETMIKAKDCTNIHTNFYMYYFFRILCKWKHSNFP